MKIKNYVVLGLLLIACNLISFAQCSVKASDDALIVCGGQVHLDALSEWSTTIDNAADIVGFRSVYFLNVDTGYTVGENGLIHRTLDGGKTWTIHNISGNSFRSVFFTDADTGFVVGKNANDAVILKTIDGGNNWSTQTFANAYGLTSVFFTSKNIGFAVGSGVLILKTTDGGNTWVKKYVSATDHFVSVNFPTPDVGYVIGEVGNVSKTIDGGETWVNDTKLMGNYPFASCFTDANTGFLACTKGMMLKTIDGGNSWTQHTVGDINDTLKAVFFVNSSVGYTGTRQAIWKTVDGGITWKKQNLVANINSIFFPNGKVGYAAGTQTLKLTEPESITWSPSTGLSSASIANPVASPNQTTKYKVTFTMLSGCTATDSVTVFVNPLTADVGNDQTLICGSGKQLNVTTNYTGTGSLSYAWFPATGLNATNIANPIASPAHTTKYYVAVTTPNGCTTMDSVTIIVNPITADAGADKVIICGGAAQLDVTTNYAGTGTLSYSWSPSTNLSATTIANPVSSATIMTTYNVKVTSTDGCSAIDSVLVLVGPLTANAGSDQTLLCKGTAQFDPVVTNYTGTGSLLYSWQPTAGLNNPNAQRPVITLPGTYTVTIATPNGCTAQDVVVVNSAQMNAIDICMVSVDTAKNLVMWNKPVSSSIDSFYVYKETNVTGNYARVGSVAYSAKSVFRDLNSQPETKSNKYKISLLDACGMESPKSIAHKTMHLTTNKGTGITWNLIWESYEGFPVATYKIYRGTTPTNLTYFDATSGSNNQYTDNNPPLGDVYYQLEAITPNPCDGLNSTHSNVARNGQVGIWENSMNTLAFSVYPNPATELLTVNVERKNNATTRLTIYNTLGAVVKTVLLEQNKQQINVSDLDNGFYTIELKSANYSGQQKLIIQK